MHCGGKWYAEVNSKTSCGNIIFKDRKIVATKRHIGHKEEKNFEPRKALKARKGSKNSWIFLKNVLPLGLALILPFNKGQYMQNQWQHKLNRFKKEKMINHPPPSLRRDRRTAQKARKGFDMGQIIKNREYIEWLKELKNKVRSSQLKAAVAVNSALLEFYWELGADIVEKQKTTNWGSGFLNQLSNDLMAEFPDMKGFSKNNLQYVRRWYSFYCNFSLKSGTGCSTIEHKYINCLFQIPWGHNLRIISKCQTLEEALFYVQKTIENNWSRSVLTHQIESYLFARTGKAITNFDNTLVKPQSDLAHEIIKDPYNFDFLTLTQSYTERELENGLIDHITKFLLELGAGFAYLGKQVPLQVGERDFSLDLLFYHTRLHCYVVVELKVVDFEPEHAGKLNFYITTIDEQLRTDRDEPTIGILLCKGKDKVVAEYALKDIHKPIGVSEYQLTKSLPEEFKSSLPAIEDIENELSGEEK